MKKLNIISSKITLVFILIFIFTYSANSQIVSEQFLNAFKTGNAIELAKHFNSSVELTILEKEQVCSKQQAEIILKDFFQKNKASSFKIIHQSNKDATNFAIGNLTTSTKVYRTYFLVKSKDGKSLIHQLRIEENDE